MPSSDKPVPRILQQQPERDSDQEQQQSGSSDFQPTPAAGKGDQQMGEGSYQATRDYQKDIEEYLKRGDIDADARAARPRSRQEARELEEAEKKGRSHSKGEH
jgi:hypothetical protein